MGSGRELLIAFGVDVDAPSFKKAEKQIASLAEATREASKASQPKKEQADKRGFAEAGAELVSAAGAIAGAGEKIGNALANAVSQTAELGQRLNKVGTGFKVSLPEYQAAEYAFGRLGVSAEELTGTMASLETKAYNASRGLDAGAVMAFSRAGIRIRKTNGDLKSGFELLESGAERLKKLPNTIATQQQMIAVFGETIGRQLGEAVRSGSFDRWKQDVKDFGAVLDDDARGAVKRFGEEQAKLGLVMKNLKQSAATPLIDSFARIGNGVTEFIRAQKGSGGKALADSTSQFQRLEPVIEKIGIALYRALPIIGKVIEGFFAVGNAIGTVATAVVSILDSSPRAGSTLAMIGAALFAAFFPVTAVLIGIGLLVDDIIGFARGDVSLFGAMLLQFPKLRAAVEEIINLFKADKWVEAFEKIGYELYRIMGRAVTAIIQKIKGLPAAIYEALKGAGDQGFFERNSEYSVRKIREANQRGPMAALDEDEQRRLKFTKDPAERARLQARADVSPVLGALGIEAPGPVPTAPIGPYAPGAGGSGKPAVAISVQVSPTIVAQGFIKEGIEMVNKLVEEGIDTSLQKLYRQISQ